MLKSANLVPNTTTKTAFVNIIVTPANFKMIIYTLMPGLFTRRLNILFPILFVFIACVNWRNRISSNFRNYFSSIHFLFNEERGKFFSVMNPPCYRTAWYTIRRYIAHFRCIWTLKSSAKVVFNGNLITFIHQLAWRL